MPEVSVIIPAYCAEGTIGNAIASSQRQTLRDIEIIVVDDASPDGTADEVLRLAAADPRIVLRRAERNHGPGAARNLGFENARGKWIALLDADDTYLPERLEHLVAIGVRQGADMVADDLLIVGDGISEGTRLLDQATLTEGAWLDATRFVNGNIGGSGRAPSTLGFLKPIIRTEFQRQAGPRYSNMRFAEDFLFYLECLLGGAKWLLTPTAYYCYVQRPGSLTHGHSADDLNSLAAAELAMLARPSVRADAQLTAAIQRHRRSVGLAASWLSFAIALKAHDYGRAGANLFQSPGSFAHIAKESLRTSARVAARCSKALLPTRAGNRV